MTCSNCGFANVAAAAYCSGCGRLLAAEGGADRAGAAAPRGHAASGPLIGERKLITVMFADIQGSLALLEGSDPERSQGLLDSVIDVMIDAVHRYGGTVNQVLGDGIMALFGAPTAQEDHAFRGCCAALAMQELVARGNAERIRRFGVETAIRIGLHSGEVVVRPMDNDVAFDYRAVGMTTHVAARLEKMARPGAVLLSGATAALVEGDARLEPLGLAPIKGMRDKVPIFELQAVSPVQSRFQVSVARGLSRLTGRKSELAMLSAALDRAEGGTRQVVALTGEPGVGKSRLCHEVAVSRRAADWAKLHAGCSSHGQTAAYLPLLGLVRSYFKIDEHDSLETIGEKIKAGLAELGPRFEAFAVVLVPFLDARADAPAWRALDPLQRRKVIFEVLRGLLAALAETRPLLLIVEDLHWLDSGSRAFLDELLSAPDKVRMALLFTFRPEFNHGWDGRPGFTQRTITSLAEAEALGLLEHLLGAHDSLRPLLPFLIERSQGNPFFMEEIVRSLAETGMLVGQRGNYRLGAADAASEAPATLEAVIAARVDRLPASAKELLQAAAVSGKTSGIDLLGRVTGMEPELMYRDLQLLRESGMLRDMQLLPSLEIGFAHALTYEVVYRSLLRARRTALHGRVVQALEAILGERAVEHVDRLADQAFRAELWDRAVAYHLLAGSRALARSACREAVAIADRGLAATAELSDEAVRARAEIDLRLLLFTALLTLGELPRLVKILGEAETLAERLGDTKRRTVVANQLAAALWMDGNHTRALAVGQRALGLARNLADPALQIAAGFQLGFVYHALGEFDRAIATHEALLPLLDGERERKRLGSVVYPSV
ncbi:MAG TPA: AAA family ATPase, partial [Candidatus Sulfotelmatobacter sp.]|nr:AAA family ATPase [Candidatus Sulfotelmatobacter sp.]